METLLADPMPTAAAEAEPASAPSAVAAPPDATQAAPAPASAEHACARCGSAMAPGQDWCLQCGAGARGSLGGRALRPAGAILAAATALALGAAAAGYAALNKTTPGPRTVIATVAQAPAATTPPPAAPPATTTPLPKTLHVTTPKLPRIPLAANTPRVPAITPTPAPTNTSTSTGTTPSSSTTTGTASEEPSAILLDTNAASTYNPSGYQPSIFGDPSLAIDGEPATAWTAQVNPVSAPRMAEGLLVDLKAKQKLAKAKLVTSTPGMTVQLYGATGKTAPGTIIDPGWVRLSHSTTLAKKHTTLKLLDATHGFRYVVLWISRAPASSTPQAPGHVDVNELELFPPS